MSDLESRLVVYEWQTKDVSLVRALFPHARRVVAASPFTGETLLEALRADDAAVLFHLNCSVASAIPRHRADVLRRLRERGVRVLNEKAEDITKRHIQACCRRLGLPTAVAPRRGPASELLMVKSNLNVGGSRDRHLPVRLRRRSGLILPPRIAFKPYTVLPRRAVRDSYWRHPGVVIERYIVNREHIIARAYIAGDRVALRLVRDLSEREDRPRFFLGHLHGRVPNLPDRFRRTLRAVARFVTAFGLDYGAIDIVLDNRWTPFIVDVNTTPSAEPRPMPRFVRHLRSGILEWGLVQ